MDHRDKKICSPLSKSIDSKLTLPPLFFTLPTFVDGSLFAPYEILSMYGIYVKPSSSSYTNQLVPRDIYEMDGIANERMRMRMAGLKTSVYLSSSPYPPHALQIRLF